MSIIFEYPSRVVCWDLDTRVVTVMMKVVVSKGGDPTINTKYSPIQFSGSVGLKIISLTFRRPSPMLRIKPTRRGCL